MSGLVPEVMAATELSTSQNEDLANASWKYFEKFVSDNSKDDGTTLADAKYVIGKIHGQMGKSTDAKDAIEAYELALLWQRQELGLTFGDDDYGSLKVRDDNEALVKDLGYTLL